MDNKSEAVKAPSVEGAIDNMPYPNLAFANYSLGDLLELVSDDLEARDQDKDLERVEELIKKRASLLDELRSVEMEMQVFIKRLEKADVSIINPPCSSFEDVRPSLLGKIALGERQQAISRLQAQANAIMTATLLSLKPGDEVWVRKVPNDNDTSPPTRFCLRSISQVTFQPGGEGGVICYKDEDGDDMYVDWTNTIKNESYWSGKCIRVLPSELPGVKDACVFYAVLSQIADAGVPFFLGKC